jgi:Tol biopolymer transport system component
MPLLARRWIVNALCLLTMLVLAPASGAQERAPLDAASKPPSAPLTSHESAFLSNLRQVTFGFEKAGEGYFSLDGQTIIYQATTHEYPFYQIYTQPLAGGKPRLVSTGRGRTTCAYFAPDGKRLLFASSHRDPMLTATEEEGRRQQEEDRRSGQRRRYVWDFDPHMDIFEANRDGSGLKPLTNVPGYDAEGAYSHDGRKIAFCSNRDGDPDIYLMNADGSDVKQLTNAPGYDGGPFISPDGKWVIFRSDRKKAEYLQIYVIRVDGQKEMALTDTNGVNWGPYWHPRQPWIIWSGADHSDPTQRPNYDLWLMPYSVEGGQFTAGKPIRVTDHAAADVLPVFSPDGKQLMWTSTRTADRTSQLWIADFRLPAEDK